MIRLDRNKSLLKISLSDAFEKECIVSKLVIIPHLK
jgi:hypothetical protein